jgi:hypothetical protein
MNSEPHDGARKLVRAPQNVVAGLALVALAAFAVWAVSHLAQGTLTSMGPAMMPRWVAIAIGLGGVAFVVSGFLADGPPLERWHLRGPVLISAAMIVFALTIRELGFLVAGPLAMIIGGFGTAEVRKVELVVFAFVMTAFCIVLFVYLLDQPIPVLKIPGTSVNF